MRCRRLRVNAKQHQQVLPMSKMPPTIGRAIAMASCHPWSPPPEPPLLDDGLGPAISVSLKMAAASGKKALPARGGCTQDMCSACRTIFVCVSLDIPRPEERGASHTVGKKQLLRNKAVAESTPVDVRTVKFAYIAETPSRSVLRSIVRDLVLDRLVQKSAADLARTADRDMGRRPGEHAT